MSRVLTWAAVIAVNVAMVGGLGAWVWTGDIWWLWLFAAPFVILMAG